MALVKRRQHGSTYKGHTIPYGTLADASQELIKVYYYHGYKEDSMLPEFPCLPYEEEPTIDPEEVVAWSRDRMANYKVPRRVVVLDVLPTNPNGKVTKFELRDLAAKFSQ